MVWLSRRTVDSCFALWGKSIGLAAGNAFSTMEHEMLLQSFLSIKKIGMNLDASDMNVSMLLTS
jgi:hypothetical protein